MPLSRVDMRKRRAVEPRYKLTPGASKQHKLLWAVVFWHDAEPLTEQDVRANRECASRPARGDATAIADRPSKAADKANMAKTSRTVGEKFFGQSWLEHSAYRLGFIVGPQ